MDMTHWFPAPWTLIGARMVQLHAMSVGRAVPRLSLDADALADVRAMPGATAKLSATLIKQGFKLGEPSAFGLAHRFVRDGVSIDVLAPDGLNTVRSRLTVGSFIRWRYQVARRRCTGLRSRRSGSAVAVGASRFRACSAPSF